MCIVHTLYTRMLRYYMRIVRTLYTRMLWYYMCIVHTLYTRMLRVLHAHCAYTLYTYVMVLHVHCAYTLYTYVTVLHARILPASDCWRYSRHTDINCKIRQMRWTIACPSTHNDLTTCALNSSCTVRIVICNSYINDWQQSGFIWVALTNTYKWMYIYVDFILGDSVLYKYLTILLFQCVIIFMLTIFNTYLLTTGAPVVSSNSGRCTQPQLNSPFSPVF